MVNKPYYCKVTFTIAAIKMVNDACNPPQIRWLLLIGQNVACLRRKNHHEPVIHYHYDIWQPSTSTPPWTNMHQPCSPAFIAGLPSDKQHDICATVSRVCAWAGRSNQWWTMGKMVDWCLMNCQYWLMVLDSDCRYWLLMVIEQGLCDLLVCDGFPVAVVRMVDTLRSHWGRVVGLAVGRDLEGTAWDWGQTGDDDLVFL